MDDTSYKLLKLYSKRDHITLADLSAIYNTDWDYWGAPVDYLIKNGYLQINPTYVILHGGDFTSKAPIEITFHGKVHLEQECKNRWTFKFNEFRAWVTLIIAIAAFVKSFFF